MQSIEEEILVKLSNRTVKYFLDDLDLKDIKADYNLESVSSIAYQDITTFIALNGAMSGTLGMSVSNNLALKMVESFIFGDSTQEELQEMSSENVSETLNITLGNILTDLSVVQNGGRVEISTPYTMHNSVTITKKKDGIMFLSTIMYNDEKILLSYFR